MLVATIVGVWLMQAPAGLPGALLPVTPTVNEWSLGGAFILKHENFLRWQAVHDPIRGWHVELRPTWLVELRPSNRRLAGLSLALESSPATAYGGSGMLRPRLQYKLAASETRVGVELPIALLVNSASGLGMRVFRPFAFVSGRF